MPRFFYTHASCAGAVSVIQKMQELLRTTEYLAERPYLAGVTCKVFEEGEVIEVPANSVALFDTPSWNRTFTPFVTENSPIVVPAWARISKWSVRVGHPCMEKNRFLHCATSILARFGNNGSDTLRDGYYPWGAKKGTTEPGTQNVPRKRRQYRRSGPVYLADVGRGW